MKYGTIKQIYVSFQTPALCSSSEEDHVVGFILDVGKDFVLQ